MHSIKRFKALKFDNYQIKVFIILKSLAKKLYEIRAFEFEDNSVTFKSKIERKNFHKFRSNLSSFSQLLNLLNFYLILLI